MTRTKQKRLYPLVALCYIIGFLLYPTFGKADQKTLKIGTLPTTSSILLHVAVEEGLFAERGLQVELIPFRSTIELTSAIRSGSLDGHFTDIVSVLIQNETGVRQKVVVNALYSNPTSRNFGIAASKNSSIQSLDDLKGRSIAISRATIIDFLLTNFLSKSCVSREECSILDINRLIIRMQTLLTDKIDAAILVEPLLSLAELKGARVLIDDRETDLVLAVIALMEKNASPDIAYPFRKAILEAAAKVEAEPQKYQKLMVEKGLIPKEIANVFPPPKFNIEKKPTPTPEDIDVFTAWMLRSNYLRSKPKYEDIVLQ